MINTFLKILLLCPALCIGQSYNWDSIALETQKKLDRNESIVDSISRMEVMNAIKLKDNSIIKLCERLTKKVEQYEQNRKYLELGISTDTTDKAWRLDKMRNLLIEIDCIKFLLKDVR